MPMRNNDARVMNQQKLMEFKPDVAKFSCMDVLVVRSQSEFVRCRCDRFSMRVELER